jgi:hypothetical protein
MCGERSPPFDSTLLKRAKGLEAGRPSWGAIRGAFFVRIAIRLLSCLVIASAAIVVRGAEQPSSTSSAPS